ncbi:MAG TPA: chain length determinant protein EpsF [Burkholderiales bacterium]|nr:chain length determinant protein EpsF [Burkholderiales bacterium]
MSLQQFLLALRSRLGVFALALAATVLAATGASLLMPKTYRATASLLVDAKEEQSLSNMGPNFFPQEKLGYLQTQMEIITSRRVAGKVVQDLRLADQPAAREAFAKATGGQGSIEDWLAENLLLKLKVETSQSSVIRVTFSASDARFSAQVANAFAKAYIDTMLELRVEPTRQAAAWYDEQLKSLKANLEEAQSKLTSYLQKNGIVSADERYDVDNSRLGALSDQVVKAQEQTFQWNARERQASKFLAEGGSVDQLPEVLDNSLVQRLKADLLLGEAKLQQLSTQYGINHPQYQRQLYENRSLRGKIDEEARKIVAGIKNSARQARQREGDLASATAAQRARLLERKENRNDFTILKRNVESAEKAYDTAMQRQVVSRVESRANQTNVSILARAEAPIKPSQPRVVLNIALSVVVGVMLGIASVLLMEMSDRRVRSVGDLRLEVLRLDVPVLAVLDTWQSAGRLPGPAHAGALPSPS